MLRLTAALVAGGLLVAACGGGGSGGDGAAGGGLADHLHGSLQQSTLFTTRHALGLTVRFDGDHELRLATIQLDTPLFEPVGPQARDARVRGSGRNVVMPLRYGAADCSQDAADAPAPRLITEVDGEEVRVALAEQPEGLLAGLHAAECEVAAVREVVDVRFGDTWERTGPTTYESTVEVAQRDPDVTATLQQMQGNVIFGVSNPGGATPWATVDDDRPAASVPLRVEASRCDPHALTEYKRTFILVAMVQVGDGEPVRIDVVAEGPAHDALAVLLEACLPEG